HPLLCLPARPGGRRTGDALCAGGVPGGAGGLSDGVPVGDAENRGLWLYRGGDLCPGELRLPVEGLRPWLAAGVCPPSPGLWPRTGRRGPAGAGPLEWAAPAVDWAPRALCCPHPPDHRRGALSGGVPAAYRLWDGGKPARLLPLFGG